MDLTTLYNQSWDFTNLFEHYYEDPYIVDANDKSLSDFIPTNTYCITSFVCAKFRHHNQGLMLGLIEIVRNDLRATWHYSQICAH